MSNQASTLMSKFRGCLAGTLVGDCLGAPFEGDQVVPKVGLQQFITKQLEVVRPLESGNFDRCKLNLTFVLNSCLCHAKI